MSFGVTDQGFVRKGLQDILSEREERNVQAFGAGIVQTAQSPTGQLNGLWSDAEAELWELSESVYLSFDPDQAEGLRLDDIGRLRAIERLPGESDDSLARAITNAGSGNVRDADFYRSIIALDGVTWARIIVNDGDPSDPELEPHSVAVAALGGSDDDIAFVARRYIVPGVASAGNTRVETTIDGYCRSIRIHRPAQIATMIEVTVNKFNDRLGCPPPPNSAIAASVLARMTGDNRPANGAAVTAHQVRLALAGFPSVEVIGVRVKKGAAAYADEPVAYAFDEIASVGANAVTVVVANA